MQPSLQLEQAQGTKASQSNKSHSSAVPDGCCWTRELQTRQDSVTGAMCTTGTTLDTRKSLGNASNLLLNFQKSRLRRTPAHPRDLLKPVFLPDTNRKGLKLTSNQNLLFADLSLPCSSADTFYNAEVCTEPPAGPHVPLPWDNISSSKSRWDPTPGFTRARLFLYNNQHPGNTFSAPAP